MHFDQATPPARTNADCGGDDVAGLPSPGFFVKKDRSELCFGAEPSLLGALSLRCNVGVFGDDDIEFGAKKSIW